MKRTSNEPILADNPDHSSPENEIVYELLDGETEQLQRRYQQLFYQSPIQSEQIISVNHWKSESDITKGDGFSQSNVQNSELAK